MAVDFHIIDHGTGDGSVRCVPGDLGSVKEAKGDLRVPNTTSPFRIVRVIDLDIATARAWIADHTDNTDPENPVLLKRRLFYLDPAKMKVQERNYWNTNRCISTTIQEARKWVVNKSTGQPQG